MLSTQPRLDTEVRGNSEMDYLPGLIFQALTTCSISYQLSQGNTIRILEWNNASHIKTWDQAFPYISPKNMKYNMGLQNKNNRSG